MGVGNGSLALGACVGLYCGRSGLGAISIVGRRGAGAAKLGDVTRTCTAQPYMSVYVGWGAMQPP